MSVSATVTPGTILSEGEAITISKLNALGTPTVDVEGAIGTLSISNNSITNAHVQAGAAIQHNKLATLNTGQLIIGTATGTPTATTISGDMTIAADGAVTLANDAVTSGKIADNAVTSAKITDDSVTAAKIADGSVGADQLADTAVVAGSYTASDITVDSQGRITSASSGVTYAKGMEVFTSSGTFTVPSGITKVKVTCVGGGQGGGSDTGAQGGVTVGLYDVSSVSTVSVTVGSGGVNSNNAGGDSSFGSFATAGGGNGSGSGGTATGGDINLTGGEQGSFNFQPTPLGYGRNAGSNSSDHAKGYGAGGGTNHNVRGGTDGIVIVEW